MAPLNNPVARLSHLKQRVGGLDTHLRNGRLVRGAPVLLDDLLPAFPPSARPGNVFGPRHERLPIGCAGRSLLVAAVARPGVGVPSPDPGLRGVPGQESFLLLRRANMT